MPDPWQPTWVSKHFPEHRHPFEHTRHSVSGGLGEFSHDVTHAWLAESALISPRSDIRESTTAFYLDVELPGVATEKQMTLNWLCSRTLSLSATVARAATPEDETSAQHSEVALPTGVRDGSSDQDKKHENQSVYLTLGEQRVGTCGRAFNSQSMLITTPSRGGPNHRHVHPAMKASGAIH